MRIILVRHGKPHYDHKTPVAGHGFAEWLRGYDHAPLDPELPPPAELVDEARAADLLLTSPLRRSQESADWLAPDRPRRVDADFQEAPLPGALTLGVRLNPHVWTRVTRLAWMLGWSPGVESASEVRARARRAAGRLVEAADETGFVMLVGHGILNAALGLELRRRGLRGPRTPRGRYWAHAVYERP